MKRPPAFQFYAKDWRSNSTIRQMTREQKGDHVEMLAASWDQVEPGSLPLPAELAAKSVGLDPRVVRNLIAKFPELWVEVDGRLVNPELRHQWQEMRERQRKLSEAGKRGNEERWKEESGGDTGGESQGESGSNRSASASAFASASAPANPDPNPAWLPSADWLEFLQMRRKKPTARAKELLLERLTELRDAGNPPSQVLRQSIRAGYPDLYELNSGRRRNGPGQKSREDHLNRLKRNLQTAGLATVPKSK